MKKHNTQKTYPLPEEEILSGGEDEQRPAYSEEANNDFLNFLKECEEARRSLVEIVEQYTVQEHLELRTRIDTLLIMYDQLYERWQSVYDLRLALLNFKNNPPTATKK